MTDIIKELQPALLTLMQLAVAALTAQLAWWLRSKQKKDAIENRTSLERDSALEAAIYAEERARLMAHQEQTLPAPETKLELAEERLKKNRAQRKLPPIRAEDAREAIETAVGTLRSQVHLASGQVKPSTQSLPPPPPDPGIVI